MAGYTEKDGLLALERRDDQVWVLADQIKAAACATVGTSIEYGGVTYRVTGTGKTYRHPKYGMVIRLYVAGAEDVPLTGGATEQQVTALKNFGVARQTANSATRDRASEWIDELLDAKSATDGAEAIARVVRRINSLGE